MVRCSRPLRRHSVHGGWTGTAADARGQGHLRLTYHLDTNAAVGLIRGRSSRLRERFRDALSRDVPIHISSLVVMELWYGVARSTRPAENADRLRVFLQGSVDRVEFAEADAESAGRLRQVLEAAGQRIGPYDLLIAATALRHGATIVTANMREFSRVPGLACEDWERG